MNNIEQLHLPYRDHTNQHSFLDDRHEACVSLRDTPRLNQVLAFLNRYRARKEGRSPFPGIVVVMTNY